MQDVTDGGIEKVAVVGNQQQGLWCLLQPVLQPQHGVEIEVVGGLIKQQQVGVGQQYPGKIETHAPAAGKTGHRIALLVGRKAKAGQHFGGACRQRPGIQRIEFFMGVADGHAVAAGFGFAQCFFGSAQRGVAIEHIINGRLIQRRHFLRHDCHAPVCRQRQTAGVRFQLAGEQGKQRAFAATIAPGQTDFPAAVQGNGGLIKQDVGAASQAQVFKLDHKSPAGSCQGRVENEARV